MNATRAATMAWAVQPTSRRLAKAARAEPGPRSELEAFVPAELRLTHLRTDLPRKARDPELTDRSKVDNNFRLNCTDVVGRDCTAAEKADVLAWLLTLKP